MESSGRQRWPSVDSELVLVGRVRRHLPGVEGADAPGRELERRQFLRPQRGPPGGDLARRHAEPIRRQGQPVEARGEPD
jgi:hypothetical protein